MSVTHQTSIGQSLLCIHRVITRGISVTMEKSEHFAEEGFPDETARKGFSGYAHALVSTTHAHHLTEDESAFPYFRDRMPDAPYDALMSDHREMEGVLQKANKAVAELEGPLPGKALSDLYYAVVRLDRIWQPHIAKEESHFNVERLNSLIEQEEHTRLNLVFMQHSQQNSGPDYLVVPFMLYNLSAEDRPTFWNEMPPVVTDELLPGPWKEQWAPMQQFLLP